jgi:hypothetical protein
MNDRERFLAAMSGAAPDDRMPMVETLGWWEETIERWEGEGLPRGLSREGLMEFFGLDVVRVIGAAPQVPPAKSHDAPVVCGRREYEALRPALFSAQCFDSLKRQGDELAAAHEAGEFSMRFVLSGFFWFPRSLFGIEPHLYAFYDEPDLMKSMNSELLDFSLRAIDALFSVLKPDFAGLSEDMSYNNGPMLSKDMFDEFLLPYYKVLTAELHSRGVPILADSDGDVTALIPWLLEAGIDGIYPLERQAGVDIAEIRRAHPDFIMMGGYDKMAMNRGESAIRAEFERILPVMRSGRFVASVDHTTPPGVSFDDYRLYVRVFREYCERAAREMRGQQTRKNAHSKAAGGTGGF